MGMIETPVRFFVSYLESQQAAHACGPWRGGDTVHLPWKAEHTLMMENGEEDSDSVATEESV
jgi:hypothetical protein